MRSRFIKLKDWALFLFLAGTLIACGVESGKDDEGGGGDKRGDTPPSTQRTSCVRHYQVVDAFGNPLTTVDDNGVSKPLTISGREYSPITSNNNMVPDVEAAGGRMVPEIDGGQSTWRFNCVGWSFRELNCHGGSCSATDYGGHGWWPDVDEVYKDFTRAGLLRKVGSYEDYEVGDKCFFFAKGDEYQAEAKHVAEVVADNWWGATVRAPDSASGVFDAEFGAEWFTTRYGDYQCYRWVDGPPRTIPDTAAAVNDPQSCGDSDDGDDGGDGDDGRSGDEDRDGDGIGDFDDNCPLTHNPDQIDSDGDGIGDLCDDVDNREDGDRDEDGIDDIDDNCPNTHNPDQIDSDGDSIGNLCDDTACPEYQRVTGACGGNLEGCIEDFYCSRQTIACEQEVCPEGAGRTYTLECCCDCWEDKSTRGVYDPCRPGFLLKCVPR